MNSLTFIRGVALVGALTLTHAATALAATSHTETTPVQSAQALAQSSGETTPLNNVQSMLQRVSELAVQYQNGDLSSQDKTDIQGEVNQLTQEIDRQRGAVQFNGINLLN